MWVCLYPGLGSGSQLVHFSPLEKETQREAGVVWMGRAHVGHQRAPERLGATVGFQSLPSPPRPSRGRCSVEGPAGAPSTRGAVPRVARARVHRITHVHRRSCSQNLTFPAPCAYNSGLNWAWDTRGSTRRGEANSTKWRLLPGLQTGVQRLSDAVVELQQHLEHQDRTQELTHMLQESHRCSRAPWGPGRL